MPIVGRDLLTVRRDDRDVLLYPWLAVRLAEALKVPADELPAGGELNAVACRYLERRGKWQRMYAALKSVMPADEELPVPEPLRRLAGIPFELFISTTFDSLLQRALDEVRFGGRPKTEILAFSPGRWDDLPAEWESLEPTVYHLFGRLSATPTYAITEEDTLEFVHSLQSGVDKPELLLDQLEGQNLLLLGANFRGWLARFFLRTAKRQPLRSPRGTTDYFADAGVRDDAGLVVFLRNFSSGSEIFEGGGAVEFVGELHRRWLERHNAAPAGEAGESVAPRSPSRGMESGSVFLSYASEDREAVETLKDALEAAGIDVFFDKQDLKAGDDFKLRLKRAIRDCSLFIPVISEHTLTGRRRFFRREWKQALDEALEAPESGRFIVPMVLDDTSPEHDAIPEAFRGIQWQRVPGGRPGAELVALVKREFRSYQKSLARAS